MNAEKPYDEPAFPIIGARADHQFNGMTMRDYFAAKALQGLCSHHDTWGLCTEEKIAETAYALADAMLAARGAA